MVEAIGHLKANHEVVVAGSASIVHALGERGLVDEYRILVFPELVGQGTRLFTDRTAPTRLRLLSVAGAGPTTLVRYAREGQ